MESPLLGVFSPSSLLVIKAARRFPLEFPLAGNKRPGPSPDSDIQTDDEKDRIRRTKKGAGGTCKATNPTKRSLTTRDLPGAGAERGAHVYLAVTHVFSFLMGSAVTLLGGHDHEADIVYHADGVTGQSLEDILQTLAFTADSWVTNASRFASRETVGSTGQSTDATHFVVWASSTGAGQVDSVVETSGVLTAHRAGSLTISVNYTFSQRTVPLTPVDSVQSA